MNMGAHIDNLKKKNALLKMPGTDAGAGLALCHRAMIVVIIGLSVLVLIKIVAFRQHQPEVHMDKLESAFQGIDSEPALTQRKPFDDYEKRLMQRNLFVPVDTMEATNTAELKKALPALHQRIKLIGILVDNDSKAIVEDLHGKQTHILSQGESVGEVFIENIQADKVIFNDAGKQVEMTL